MYAKSSRVIESVLALSALSFTAAVGCRDTPKPLEEEPIHGVVTKEFGDPYDRPGAVELERSPGGMTAPETVKLQHFAPYRFEMLTDNGQRFIVVPEQCSFCSDDSNTRAAASLAAGIEVGDKITVTGYRPDPNDNKLVHKINVDHIAVQRVPISQ